MCLKTGCLAAAQRSVGPCTDGLLLYGGCCPSLTVVLISQSFLYVPSLFHTYCEKEFLVCQRPSYQCPSMFCDTPMVHHIRRFVHGQGCVQIILKELDSPVPGYQHTILTYSWCRICKQVSRSYHCSLSLMSLFV